MTQRVALVHTVANLEPVFAALARELLPAGTEVAATVDEALLGETIEAGRIQPGTARRLRGHIARALDAGNDLVLVTCSSVGPAVEQIAGADGRPILRIDEAMADRALELGRRIGVIATLVTTLEPTADLIRRRAARLPNGTEEIEIVTHLCEGAFAALKAGDLERHDALVRAGLTALLPRVDVVVLAQASMARVAEALPPQVAGDRPILSSPRLAMERVAARLAELDAGAVSRGG
jgi:Asp/Glu/hydantoin racemase